jgi:hypothetical protein
MKRTATPSDIQRTLEELTRGQQPTQELVINPDTWEIETLGSDQRPMPDSMPLRPVAGDFYAGR